MMMRRSGGSSEGLFETRAARGGAAHKAISATILAAIISVWAYRLTHIPAAGGGRYAWIGMLCSEAVLGLYWIICQSCRWTVVHRFPFKDRLSSTTRYEEKLPAVDMFVCTADPVLEPPSMVASTVLSLMSYNYPPEKMSVYVSDDGGSELTLYALLEASDFCKYWIPFSKRYNVEPRSPHFYFSHSTTAAAAADESGSSFVQEWATVKKLFDEMRGRIDSAAKEGRVPQEIRVRHKGFSEWNSKNFHKHDHQSIVQILIDGWNPKARDMEGNRLPTLVYLSREKRPAFPHNFKAGSMNALIRVSSEISNAPIILNVDCDMYVNDPDAIQDALCFFLDEKHGSPISYVQYPQHYHNIAPYDVYANRNFAINDIELCGLDGLGVALYVGTGCFHRRESLSGKKFSGDHRVQSGNVEDNINGRSLEELQSSSKNLATCSYEKGTPWGKEMGLVYGCAVEDIVTGLSIQCRGWKPVYYNPRKPAFEGIAPTTLGVSLIQFTRWSEGMFQIFLSSYCPFVFGRCKISLAAQIGYCTYLVWPLLSLPTLYYAVVPALSLLCSLPLFPEASTPWMVPFAYAFLAKTGYSLAEEAAVGNSLKGWWNLQRIVVMRRTTAYLLALVETVLRMAGLSKAGFVLTAKVVDEEAEERYKKGVMEFGSSSSVMMVIVATVALVNLLGLGWGAAKALRSPAAALDEFAAQVAICGVLVVLNLPVYEGMLFRKDKGRMGFSVLLKSLVITTSLVAVISVY